MFRHIHDFAAVISNKYRIVRLRSQKLQCAVHHLPLHLQLDATQQLLVLEPIDAANEIELRRITLVALDHEAHAARGYFTPQPGYLRWRADLLLHAVNRE
ncbi:hypothetical protein D3C77_494210 [compost metagenome]